MLLPLKALVDGQMRYYGGRFKDPGFFAQESLVAKSIRGKNLRCEFVYFIQMTLVANALCWFPEVVQGDRLIFFCLMSGISP